MKKKPALSFWQIWYLSFGFLGVQFGFALQNANVSRILSSLGANLHSLSLFWLAAPMMGLIVQPIVGGASDRTWNRLGRRLPFILGGAIVSITAMFLMPNSSFITSIMSPIIFGACMLALMDGSFNVTFQPFRALVADMLPDEQRNIGYSIQSFLINAGAVIGSVLPYFMTNVLGVRNVAPEGKVPPSVVWSFYIGGTVLILSVLLTIFRTKEYSPEKMREFEGIKEETPRVGFFKTLFSMPRTMLQLAVVQFFSWFALYLMWVFTTPAVAQHYWHTPVKDASSAAYNEAGNWVGIIFGAYSLFAAFYSVIMPWLARKISRKLVYSLSIFCGGIGYISMFFFHDPHYLIFSMVGIGIAWASILAMPYAILSSALPARQMGIYMGIFNFTIAGPQICSGLFGGLILEHFFKGEAIYMLVLAGVSMLIGCITVYFVKDKEIKEEDIKE
ncbi:MAG: MFS transporter [Bacteroidota bacterium]|nr:MFS transporter [Bacteroidota bacterium]MDP4204516.1 MFS transporter [Bacteroidota bacterium]